MTDTQFATIEIINSNISLNHVREYPLIKIIGYGNTALKVDNTTFEKNTCLYNGAVFELGYK